MTDWPRLCSQRQPGQDYHITDRIPFPYKVTSFIREMETDLINVKLLFEFSLLSISRHEELIDWISFEDDLRSNLVLLTDWEENIFTCSKRIFT